MFFLSKPSLDELLSHLKENIIRELDVLPLKYLPFSDTFPLPYISRSQRKLLTELEKYSSIPPELDSRPIFKNGGYFYREGLREILELNSFTQKNNSLKNKKIAILASNPQTGQIGTEDNKLPWVLSDDILYFQAITTACETVNSRINVVIMGRKTWQSIPKKYRPLKDRLNIVLSKNYNSLTNNSPGDNSLRFCSSISEAQDFIESLGDKINNVFVIGGSNLYQNLISQCDYVFLTKVYTDVDTTNVKTNEICLPLAELLSSFSELSEKEMYSLLSTVNVDKSIYSPRERISPEGLAFQFSIYQKDLV